MSVRYGPVVALSDIDLTVETGERVALVGSSGAGKSTLLGVLSGLANASSGTVRVLGADHVALRGRRLRAHRSRIGTVGQNLGLSPSLRVVHNVNGGRLGAWSTARAVWSLVAPRGRAEVDAVLDRVGLDGMAMARTDSLSGGEQQRVAVARVLVQQPELVLADEPISSVDPRLSDHVLSLLCGPAEKAPWTTIVSLHEPAFARQHTTRIIGLRDGRITFDRHPDEVSDRDLADLYQERQR